MAWIPAGEFTMGSDATYARLNERPARTVTTTGFWIDATEVTNAQFRRFIDDTGYVTTAEQPVDWEVLKTQLPPGTPKPPEHVLQPGSLVFTPPDHPVPTSNVALWWTWTTGASWRHPEGPGSTIDGRDDHPVVHVSWFDAMAYAEWAGKQLPTEAHWERAARLGSDATRYIWGDELHPRGVHMTNIWQGTFPHHNLVEDGFARTAPVASFPATEPGLFDMAGNVWEWTRDAADPRFGDATQHGLDAASPPTMMVQKGGSFLCHVSYCESYRPSAKMSSTPDSSLGHLGFRCVVVPEIDDESGGEHEPE
ncbi:MAG: formylglycine-generating enzyme family protein [Planctomycetota bacterium]